MNRTKGDEEEYWNSSKFKAFTFDDEDDELSQVGFHEQLLQITPPPQCHSQIPSPYILGNLAFDCVSIGLYCFGSDLQKNLHREEPSKKSQKYCKNQLSALLTFMLKVIYSFQFLFPPPEPQVFYYVI